MKSHFLFSILLLCILSSVALHALPKEIEICSQINGAQVTFGEAARIFGELKASSERDVNLRFRISAEDGAVLTRGMLAQLVYNVETASVNALPSYDALASLVARLRECMPKIATVSALSDVDYNHPNDIAVHYAIANGFMTPRDDTSFGADDVVTAEDFRATVRRLAVSQPKLAESLRDDIGEILSEGRSELAKLAATNLYKKASWALAHPQFPKDEKASIRTMLDAIKNGARKIGNVEDVVGSKADPCTYIYKIESNLHLNDVTIESRKPESDPVEIVIFADTHFNGFNAQDEAEQNPSLMSTKQYRKWLADGASAPCVGRLMDFARYSDQTVVAGDVLDFLSWGAKQLTVENVFRKDVALMACLGGHDVTRVMQGKVPDPTSLESRRKILADFWPNDIIYDSRVVKDKVMLVVMDNGLGQFYPSQVDKFKADVERARANDWIILVVVHEPICTRNVAHKDTQPFMKGDPDIDTNFYDHRCCRAGQSAASDAIFDLITRNADVVRGVFNGHEHSAYYTWFNGTYAEQDGTIVEKPIPQHTVTCCVYRSGCLAVVTVK
ncbi:MAG: hypothetical protein MJ106_04275 [Lentisphaeria bacterium]|nr:hypothetical protein [Lentisphaeria bacterium]